MDHNYCSVTFDPRGATSEVSNFMSRLFLMVSGRIVIIRTGRAVRLFPALLTLAFFGSAVAGVESQTLTEQDRARLKVVVQYADNVLSDAADHFRQEPTPLLANGLNVYTKAPVEWVYRDGSRAVISDFAQQQNFMRVLAALSQLTGEPKYKAAARAEIAYYFAHYQDRGGLLHWGGHRFVDLRTLRPVAFGPQDRGAHELKNVFPFYELMYEVYPEATVRFITGFWNAHVYNWHTLEISRHGEVGRPPGAQWTNAFADPKPYFETKGLSFLDAGNDLIYSAAMLYKLSGDKGALVWANRLAAQYVKARNPQTQLGAYQFTQPRKTADTTNDSDTLSLYGDRAKRQFGPDFPDHLVLEATMLLRRLAGTIYSENALMELDLSQSLGREGQDFLKWTQQGLDSFASYAYVPGRHSFRPMLTDGTDLTGYVLKRNGYYGRAGTKLDLYPAGPEFMLSFARAFMLTGDTNLWAVARGVAESCELGDIGTAPARGAHLNLDTPNSDAIILFSLLDLYQETRHQPYLELARAVGNNLVKNRWHHGYFTAHEDQINANIDELDPYALLALHATILGTPGKVPHFLNGSGFVDAEYLFSDGKARRTKDVVLYRPRKSGSGVPVPGDRDPNMERTE